jgi:type VI secretion system protein ImpH
MADASGTPVPPLIQALCAEAHRFSFFQAVALLERAHPNAVRVGGIGPAEREVIRFRPDVAMSFAPSSLTAVERIARRGEASDDASVYRITAAFLGLYGAQSPLPNHWSEEILREHLDDSTVRDFLDIFHHRVYAFFYRAWSKYRFHAQHARDGSDPFTQRFLALVGLRLREVREATQLPAVRLLKYAGILLQRSRPAESLERLLSDWFGGLPVRVVACAPRWVKLRSQSWNRLGVGPSTLGVDMTLGTNVYDLNTSYRIIMGPVDLATYLRFLPEGQDRATLVSLSDFFTSRLLEAQVEVRLHGRSVPTARLDEAEPPRLGWTSWLASDAHAEASVSFHLGEAA